MKYSNRIPTSGSSKYYCEVSRSGDLYLGSKKSGSKDGAGLLISSRGVVADGTWKSGKQEGYGVQAEKSGKIYAGEFVAGKKDGIGKLKNTKLEHLGQFKKGRATGIGIRKDVKNRVIKGQFQEGVPHGYAFLQIEENNYMYRGQFNMGVYEGIGEEKLADRIHFGQFSGQRKHGVLQLKISQQLNFLGHWQHDIRHGFGMEKFHNGDSYYGDFEEGKRTGIGKYNYHKIGYVYLGGLQSGQRQGYGQLEGKDSNYQGSWFGGKREGIGYQKNEERSYFGQWKADQRDGLGFELSKLTEYRGMWKDNKPHGKGVLFLAGNKTYLCYFEKGILIKKLDKQDRSILKLFDKLDLKSFIISSNKKLSLYEEYIDNQARKLMNSFNSIDFPIDQIENEINQNLLKISKRASTLFEKIQKKRKIIRALVGGLTKLEDNDLNSIIDSVGVINRSLIVPEKSFLDNYLLQIDPTNTDLISPASHQAEVIPKSRTYLKRDKSIEKRNSSKVQNYDEIIIERLQKRNISELDGENNHEENIGLDYDETVSLASQKHDSSSLYHLESAKEEDIHTFRPQRSIERNVLHSSSIGGADNLARSPSNKRIIKIEADSISHSNSFSKSDVKINKLDLMDIRDNQPGINSLLVQASSDAQISTPRLKEESRSRLGLDTKLITPSKRRVLEPPDGRHELDEEVAEFKSPRKNHMKQQNFEEDDSESNSVTLNTRSVKIKYDAQSDSKAQQIDERAALRRQFTVNAKRVESTENMGLESTNLNNAKVRRNDEDYSNGGSVVSQKSIPLINLDEDSILHREKSFEHKNEFHSIRDKQIDREENYDFTKNKKTLQNLPEVKEEHHIQLSEKEGEETSRVELRSNEKFQEKENAFALKENIGKNRDRSDDDSMAADEDFEFIKLDPVDLSIKRESLKTLSETRENLKAHNSQIKDTILTEGIPLVFEGIISSSKASIRNIYDFIMNGDLNNKIDNTPTFKRNRKVLDHEVIQNSLDFEEYHEPIGLGKATSFADQNSQLESNEYHSPRTRGNTFGDYNKIDDYSSNHSIKQGVYFDTASVRNQASEIKRSHIEDIIYQTNTIKPITIEIDQKQNNPAVPNLKATDDTIDIHNNIINDSNESFSSRRQTRSLGRRRDDEDEKAFNSGFNDEEDTRVDHLNKNEDTPADKTDAIDTTNPEDVIESNTSNLIKNQIDDQSPLLMSSHPKDEEKPKNELMHPNRKSVDELEHNKSNPDNERVATIQSIKERGDGKELLSANEERPLLDQRKGFDIDDLLKQLGNIDKGSLKDSIRTIRSITLNDIIEDENDGLLEFIHTSKDLKNGVTETLEINDNSQDVQKHYNKEESDFIDIAQEQQTDKNEDNVISIKNTQDSNSTKSNELNIIKVRLASLSNPSQEIKYSTLDDHIEGTKGEIYDVGTSAGSGLHSILIDKEILEHTIIEISNREKIEDFKNVKKVDTALIISKKTDQSISHWAIEKGKVEESLLIIEYLDIENLLDEPVNDEHNIIDNENPQEEKSHSIESNDMTAVPINEQKKPYIKNPDVNKENKISSIQQDEYTGYNENRRAIEINAAVLVDSTILMQNTMLDRIIVAYLADSQTTIEMGEESANINLHVDERPLNKTSDIKSLSNAPTNLEEIMLLDNTIDERNDSQRNPETSLHLDILKISNPTNQIVNTTLDSIANKEELAQFDYNNESQVLSEYDKSSIQDIKTQAPPENIKPIRNDLESLNEGATQISFIDASDASILDPGLDIIKVTLSQIISEREDKITNIKSTIQKEALVISDNTKSDKVVPGYLDSLQIKDRDDTVMKSILYDPTLEVNSNIFENLVREYERNNTKNKFTNEPKKIDESLMKEDEAKQNSNSALEEENLIENTQHNKSEDIIPQSHMHNKEATLAKSPKLDIASITLDELISLAALLANNPIQNAEYEESRNVRFNETLKASSANPQIIVKHLRLSIFEENEDIIQILQMHGNDLEIKERDSKIKENNAFNIVMLDKVAHSAEDNDARNILFVDERPIIIYPSRKIESKDLSEVLMEEVLVSNADSIIKPNIDQIDSPNKDILEKDLFSQSNTLLYSEHFPKETLHSSQATTINSELAIKASSSELLFSKENEDPIFIDIGVPKTLQSEQVSSQVLNVQKARDIDSMTGIKSLDLGELIVEESKIQQQVIAITDSSSDHYQSKINQEKKEEEFPNQKDSSIEDKKTPADKIEDEISEGNEQEADNKSGGNIQTADVSDPSINIIQISFDEIASKRLLNISKRESSSNITSIDNSKNPGITLDKNINPENTIQEIQTLNFAQVDTGSTKNVSESIKDITLDEIEIKENNDEGMRNIIMQDMAILSYPVTNIQTKNLDVMVSEQEMREIPKEENINIPNHKEGERNTHRHSILNKINYKKTVTIDPSTEIIKVTLESIATEEIIDREILMQDRDSLKSPKNEGNEDISIEPSIAPQSNNSEEINNNRIDTNKQENTSQIIVYNPITIDTSTIIIANSLENLVHEEIVYCNLSNSNETHDRKDIHIVPPIQIERAKSFDPLESIQANTLDYLIGQEKENTIGSLSVGVNIVQEIESNDTENVFPRSMLRIQSGIQIDPASEIVQITLDKIVGADDVSQNINYNAILESEDDTLFTRESFTKSQNVIQERNPNFDEIRNTRNENRDRIEVDLPSLQNPAKEIISNTLDEISLEIGEEIVEIKKSTFEPLAYLDNATTEESSVVQELQSKLQGLQLDKAISINPSVLIKNRTLEEISTQAQTNEEFGLVREINPIVTISSQADPQNKSSMFSQSSDSNKSSSKLAEKVNSDIKPIILLEATIIVPILHVKNLVPLDLLEDQERQVFLLENIDSKGGQDEVEIDSLVDSESNPLEVALVKAEDDDILQEENKRTPSNNESDDIVIDISASRDPQINIVYNTIEDVFEKEETSKIITAELNDKESKDALEDLYIQQINQSEIDKISHSSLNVDSSIVTDPSQKINSKKFSELIAESDELRDSTLFKIQESPNKLKIEEKTYQDKFAVSPKSESNKDNEEEEINQLKSDKAIISDLSQDISARYIQELEGEEDCLYQLKNELSLRKHAQSSQQQNPFNTEKTMLIGNADLNNPSITLISKDLNDLLGDSRNDRYIMKEIIATEDSKNIKSDRRILKNDSAVVIDPSYIIKSAMLIEFKDDEDILSKQQNMIETENYSSNPGPDILNYDNVHIFEPSKSISSKTIIELEQEEISIDNAMLSLSENMDTDELSPINKSVSYIFPESHVAMINDPLNSIQAKNIQELAIENKESIGEESSLQRSELLARIDQKAEQNSIKNDKGVLAEPLLLITSNNIGEFEYNESKINGVKRLMTIPSNEAIQEPSVIIEEERKMIDSGITENAHESITLQSLTQLSKEDNQSEEKRSDTTDTIRQTDIAHKDKDRNGMLGSDRAQLSDPSQTITSNNLFKLEDEVKSEAKLTLDSTKDRRIDSTQVHNNDRAQLSDPSQTITTKNLLELQKEEQKKNSFENSTFLDSSQTLQTDSQFKSDIASLNNPSQVIISTSFLEVKNIEGARVRIFENQQDSHFTIKEENDRARISDPSQLIISKNVLEFKNDKDVDNTINDDTRGIKVQIDKAFLNDPSQPITSKNLFEFGIIEELNKEINSIYGHSEISGPFKSATSHNTPEFRMDSVINQEKLVNATKTDISDNFIKDMAVISDPSKHIKSKRLADLEQESNTKDIVSKNILNFSRDDYFDQEEPIQGKEPAVVGTHIIAGDRALLFNPSKTISLINLIQISADGSSSLQEDFEDSNTIQPKHQNKGKIVSNSKDIAVISDPSQKIVSKKSLGFELVEDKNPSSNNLSNEIQSRDIALIYDPSMTITSKIIFEFLGMQEDNKMNEGIDKMVSDNRDAINDNAIVYDPASHITVTDIRSSAVEVGERQLALGRPESLKKADLEGKFNNDRAMIVDLSQDIKIFNIEELKDRDSMDDEEEGEEFENEGDQIDLEEVVSESVLIPDYALTINPSTLISSYDLGVMLNSDRESLLSDREQEMKQKDAQDLSSPRPLSNRANLENADIFTPYINLKTLTPAELFDVLLPLSKCSPFDSPSGLSNIAISTVTRAVFGSTQTSILKLSLLSPGVPQRTLTPSSKVIDIRYITVKKVVIYQVRDNRSLYVVDWNLKPIKTLEGNIKKTLIEFDENFKIGDQPENFKFLWMRGRNEVAVVGYGASGITNKVHLKVWESSSSQKLLPISIDYSLALDTIYTLCREDKKDPRNNKFYVSIFNAKKSKLRQVDLKKQFPKIEGRFLSICISKDQKHLVAIVKTDSTVDKDGLTLQNIMLVLFSVNQSSLAIKNMCMIEAMVPGPRIRLRRMPFQDIYAVAGSKHILLIECDVKLAKFQRLRSVSSVHEGEINDIKFAGDSLFSSTVQKTPDSKPLHEIRFMNQKAFDEDENKLTPRMKYEENKEKDLGST